MFFQDRSVSIQPGGGIWGYSLLLISLSVSRLFNVTVSIFCDMLSILWSRIKEKVGIVTGASKSIGAGIVKGFGKAGATVVVNYASSKSDADKVVFDRQKLITQYDLAKIEL